MSAATTTAGLPSRSAPPQDRPASPVPDGIAEILAVLAILIDYGRHLGQTLEQRAVARGFATIAQYFGTVAFDTILAHIQRGLMRAIALQRLLLRRAAPRAAATCGSWHRAQRPTASRKRRTQRIPRSKRAKPHQRH